MSRVESRAAPVYRDILAGHLPEPNQQRADFAVFLAYLLLRTPAVRRDVGELIGRHLQIMQYAYGINDKAFEGLLRRHGSEDGEELDPEVKAKVREWMLDPTHYTLQMSKEQTLMALSPADTLAKMFFDMKWSIMNARHGFFITSDNPVTRMTDPKTHHPFYGDHGFNNKTVQVTFPLSPRAALLMSWQSDEPDVMEVGRASVENLNDISALFADRYLYGHVERSALQKLAEKFRGSRPRLETKGFGPQRFTKVEVLRRRPRGG